MSYSTLDPSLSHAAPPWQRETVQSFFAGFSWNGAQTYAASSQATTPGGSPSVPQSATVRAFFESFPWEGQPIIGMPITPVAAQQPLDSAATNLTLDDISSLFG
ncbi:MAG: hypothetical protein HC929_03925 [Leptolyngbyaceae cyanobacterium SM2_5_2]|nr:hypothetical protein [Leptolyngbyaceae cyanobacterium SM2_5_2]